ncbi:MAG: tol-pal system protein YbgF [Pseudolabrys sp.]|nr:tol-pal system protein YbgF [Pseudolabrys sp.]MSP31368.1 tol-pal system protein YbgF [Pseudolabrys sp.]
MTHSRHPFRMTALAALPVLLFAGTALAQDRSSGGFLDNLFSRGEQNQPQGQSQVEVRRGGQGNQAAQADPGDLTVRLDRLENALRQLTGTIEQLQYRNQQLEMQLKRMQDDTEFRLQQLGSKGGAQPGAIPGAPVNANQPPRPGNRSDVFDPSQRPNAPGAPRVLGNASAVAAPAQNPADEPQLGAPGGRAAGAPLDLSTLSGTASAPPPAPMANAAPVQGSQAASQSAPQPASQLPPVMRNTGAGTQLATLPPSASPQDEYDLAYGYVLHKDYALAEQAFRDFLRKYPNERLVPDAQYWLGESLFQRQRYRDAAESFLAVSTKYEKAGKAPDSLLRLGQSLAAMNQKEAACATLAEVGRKFPRASASVKRGVTQEQKRAHC